MKVFKNIRCATAEEVANFDKILLKLVSTMVIDNEDEFIVYKINDQVLTDKSYKLNDLYKVLMDVDFIRIFRFSDITGYSRFEYCDRNILIDMYYVRNTRMMGNARSEKLHYDRLFMEVEKNG